MSSASVNKSISRLIVGAMSIDGELNEEERLRVAKILDFIGMPDLIADVGAAIESTSGQFDLYKECRLVKELIKDELKETAPLIFRTVSDVLAVDRFLSTEEALYLSSMARQLGISSKVSKQILKEVMTNRRARLQKSAKDIDADFNPQLRELLSFEGADDLVGEVSEDELGELFHNTKDDVDITREEMQEALIILGLKPNSTIDDAKKVWLDTINTLDLPKMSTLGETFVTAAINRITKVNSAYRTILNFYDQIGR